MRPSVATTTVLLLLSYPASVMAHQRPLQSGSTGSEVRAWQQALRIGGASITVDGIFGPETMTATRAFQRRSVNGLRPDGIVDLDDVKAWLGASLACCGAGHPESWRGVVGSGVGWLQISLNRWLRKKAPDFPTLNVDMVFGHHTEAAVRRLQSTVGLAADGVAGQKTWRALSRAGVTHFP